MSSNLLSEPFSRPGRLQRRLTRRIGAVVAVVAVLLSLLSTAVIRQLLLNDIDQKLHNVLRVEPGKITVDIDRLRVGGLPGGSMVVISQPEGLQGQEVTDYGFDAPAGDKASQVLKTTCDARAHTQNLAGYGNYRILCVEVPNGATYVAIPTASADRLVLSVLLCEALIGVVAVGVAVFGAHRIVSNSLRPLNELVGVATQVADLPLDEGEVDLDIRVPASGESDDEVDRVSTAFNTMLDHVEDSLKTRQDSEQRIRQFVADASHELRNPLAAIRGYAELMGMNGAELTANMSNAVTRIDSESKRMSRLVEDMLLLARLDNRQPVQFQQVDLVELVLNAVSDAQVAASDHHWLMQLPSEPVMVNADPSRLYQVIANLLGNARKHTPASTTVTTSVTTTPEQVFLRVADDGPGIAETLLPHVFERFARADVARAHCDEGSTGLGLAIVAAIVQAHGGTVQVANDHGAVFTIALPVLSQN